MIYLFKFIYKNFHEFLSNLKIILIFSLYIYICSLFLIKLTKLKHKILIGSLIIFIFGMAGFISILSSNKTVSTDFSQANMKCINSSASGLNQSNINDLLDDRISDYNQYGCFQEYYSPSIRDTYFALYVLDAIGKLHQIDEGKALQYIMSHYDPVKNEFQDDYSLRFYDLVDSEAYYQNSPLLTYCYAVFSLIILDELSALNQDNIKNYIWSCYDPITGGFFGYHSPINSPQNIPTAENTFFAVELLNALNINWDYYLVQRDQIISFLNALQIQSPYNSYTHGGFNNDLEPLVDTVFRYDPNLCSAFFAITTLNSFGMLDVINIENFLQYIGGLYDSNSGCFYYNYFNKITKIYNIFSTALGMELADIVGYTYDNMLSINFLLDFRMNGGGWENTQNLGNYELIDTYEVIRYFKRNEKLFYLDALTKEEIYLFVLRFQQIEGFSSLSRDYTSLKVVWNTVSSFDLNYRISDLNLQELYELIESAHKNYTFGNLGEGTFYGPATSNLTSVNYRTAPLEYKGTKKHIYSQEIGFLHSVEHIFYALSALDNIYKLDDFSSVNNLTELLEHIIACQFLEPGYTRYGGFIPDYIYTLYPPENYEDHIYLHYSYFTIRCIEILDTFLDDGDITNNGIDIDALCTFISRGVMESSQYLYYDSYYSDDFSDILKDIYYMVYVLTSVGRYNLDTQKIINYIFLQLDYSNFRDIYYVFKISKVLNITMDFDIVKVRTLLHSLYIEDEKEYFATSTSETIDTDMVFWICDIAVNDDIRLYYQIDDNATLGYTFRIEASLCNLILDSFGPTVTVKFESDMLGTIILDKNGENLYEKDIYIDLNPDYLPKIDGKICVYSGIDKVIETSVEINTNIDIIFEHCYTNNSNSITVEFNYTVNTSSGYSPMSEIDMYASVFLNGTFIENISLNSFQIGKKNYFNLTYGLVELGSYIFDFYVIHPFLDPDIYSPEIGKKELTLQIYYSNELHYQVDNNATLGHSFHIEANLSNPIFDSLGSPITVRFESDKLGTIILDRNGENLYEKDIYLDLNPDYLPKIYGNLCVYSGIEKIIETPIEINTNIDIISEYSYVNNSNSITMEFNYTVNTSSGYSPMSEIDMYVSVFFGGVFIENVSLESFQIGQKNYFNLTYGLVDLGSYIFDFYVIHPFLDPDIYSPNIGKKELTLQTYYSNELYYQIDNNATLGHSFHIEASLSNLILDNFGPTVTVKFESDMLGTIILDKNGENLYEKDIYLNLNPNYLPKINGNLCVYSGAEKIIEHPVEINTSIDIISELCYTNNSNSITVEFNYTVNASSGYTPMSEIDMYASVFLNGTFIENVSLESFQIGQKNYFNLTYGLVDLGSYIFDFFIIHPFLDPNIFDPEIGKKELTLQTYYSNELYYQIDNNATLGHSFHLEASLSNPILDSFGPTVTVKFESDKFGTIILDKNGENLYEKDIYLDLNPDYLPKINGNLCVYSGVKKIIEIPVDINTSIDIISEHCYTNNSNSITVEFNYTIDTSSGYTPMSGTSMYVNIIINDTFIENISLESSQIGLKNHYSITYDFIDSGSYIFNFYIIHPFLDPDIFDPEIGKKELTFHIYYSNGTLPEIPDNDTSDNNNSTVTDNDEDNEDDSEEPNDSNYNIPAISGIFGFGIILTVSSTIIRRKYKKNQITDIKNKISKKHKKSPNANKALKA